MNHEDIFLRHNVMFENERQERSQAVSKTMMIPVTNTILVFVETIFMKLQFYGSYTIITACSFYDFSSQTIFLNNKLRLLFICKLIIQFLKLRCFLF